LFEIEDLWSSDFGEAMAGRELANGLRGGAGADSLSGGAGDDRLPGGVGGRRIVLADPAKDRGEGGKGIATQLERTIRQSRNLPDQLSLGGLSIARNYPPEIFADHLVPVRLLAGIKG
jgi:Ca2+-binding RTX toxin-like protein